MIRLVALFAIDALLLGALVRPITPDEPPLPLPKSAVLNSEPDDRGSVGSDGPPPIRKIGHPLFTSLERPADRRSSDASVGIPHPNTIRLLGTAATTDRVFAVFVAGPAQGPRKVAPGDLIDNWRVKRIDRRGVDLIAADASGQHLRIELDPNIERQ